MSETKFGHFVWQDLTVPNADEVRDFYMQVAGWTWEGVDMGGYQDYSMLASDGTGVGGICHKSGPNAGIPSQWLLYISVPDVAAAAAKCVEHGGKVIEGPRDMGGHSFCVIQDPAGAVCALIGGGG